MIYYCLGGYHDPSSPKDFCTTIFPDGNMVHLTEEEARKASKNPEMCGGAALYMIDTESGKGDLIEKLESNEKISPKSVQHEYLKETPEKFKGKIKTNRVKI